MKSTNLTKAVVYLVIYLKFFHFVRQTQHYLGLAIKFNILLLSNLI